MLEIPSTSKMKCTGDDLVSCIIEIDPFHGVLVMIENKLFVTSLNFPDTYCAVITPRGKEETIS